MTTPSQTKKVSSQKPSKPSKKLSRARNPRVKQALPKAVLRFVKAKNLWSPGDKLLIAVSGGPDSIALLHILLLFAKKENLELGIAHVNYHLRGEDSAKEAFLVEKVANENNLPLFIHDSYIKPKKNIEAALREVRYTFFHTILRQKKYDFLVLGHQENDQAETLLLRLLRGSGKTGLQAMQPKDGLLLRPLLTTSREEILEFLKESKVKYCLDKSNLSSRYTRNQIRHTLIPFLEKKFQPNIRKILARTAALFQESSLEKAKIVPIPVIQTKNAVSFSLLEVLSLKEPALALFLRDLLKYFLDYPLPQALIKEIIQTLKSTKNKHHEMTFRGLKLERKGARVTLRKLSQLL